MKITGSTRELNRAVRQLGRLTSSTLPLAAAKALTTAAQAVARAMPAEVARSLDRPTPFTASASALFIQPATPGNLTAVVGYKDRQARSGNRLDGIQGLGAPVANLGERGVEDEPLDAWRRHGVRRDDGSDR